MDQKRIALSIAAGLLLFAAGYGLGRTRTPDEMQIAEAVVERDQPLTPRVAMADELERSRSRIVELEQELQHATSLARPEPRRVPSSEAESSPRAEAQAQSEASVPGGLLAPQWLRDLDPGRFGDLTAEEASLLRELQLRGGQVGDEALALLSTLPNLRSLDLRGASITDDGLPNLMQLTNLQSLELRGTKITGAGLRYLPAYQLEALHLTDTEVRGDDLIHMPPMPRLRTLKLNRLEFDDQDVEYLASYTNLRHLEIDQTAITDSGLERLMQLHPQLTRLELRDTAITDETRRRMVELYPRCDFEFQSYSPYFGR